MDHPVCAEGADTPPVPGGECQVVVQYAFSDCRHFGGGIRLEKSRRTYKNVSWDSEIGDVSSILVGDRFKVRFVVQESPFWFSSIADTVHMSHRRYKTSRGTFAQPKLPTLSLLFRWVIVRAPGVDVHM